MFQFQYQVKRISNMANEWWRLTKLFIGRDDSYRGDKKFFSHLRLTWRMNGYKQKNESDYLSRPTKYILVRDPIWPKGHVTFQRDSEGNFIECRRDLFDQVIDTISEIISLYWRNIFIEQACTHPHEDVEIEWYGDDEYGRYKQHRCNRCGGYIGNPNNDVDRYLPQDQRRPDLIKGDPISPWNR